MLSKTLARKIVLALIFMCALQLVQAQTRSGRPKIGVTLSGGGAKGLAHIGILKAIDSAGLKVDYITGTSMGSIIGSLYAIGYSADSIRKITQAIDWDLLLSNQSSLRSIFMEEKDEYSKYILELPWVNHRFRLPSGVLEGQELWIKFSELFFPVYNIKDFSQFSIPFRCIGTDVGTGEAVVMKDGEIVSAIRSSMAIPSVFTAVDYKGKRLIDGGLVRNFPVRDVKEMGADFVIGSNVASGLLPSDKVRNAFQILMQVAFFREAEDNKVEVPQCDIYVPFNMEKYSMGSFGDAQSILNLGLEEGRKIYPKLKALKDSLDAIYGQDPPTPERLPVMDHVKISSYEVNGTEKTSPDFFTHTMDFTTNQYYSSKRLANMVRQAVGTRYYKRVTYSLMPLPDGTARIIFDVTENPLTFAKLGLHYNRFSGIGVIANLTTRNFLATNSRSMVSLNIGESFRIRGEHLQYFGRLKNFALIADLQFDRFDVATYTYDKYKQDGLYKQNLFRTGGRFQFSSNRRFSMGIGSRWDWVRYTPTIQSDFNFRGSNSWVTNFLYVGHNSLDKTVYPRRGVKFDAEAGYIARQSPRIKFIFGDQTIPATEDDISGDSYPRVTANLESYIPFSRRTTLLINAQGGTNFGYEKNVLNEFIVGGLTKTFRNQITFAGLQEGTIYSPSLLALQGGARVMVLGNTYLTARANVLFNNLLTRNELFDYPDFFSGYALTFSYNFALGPLEISAMYCDQTKRVQSYINLGIPF